MTIIWGLLDDRPGHANQVRGVVDALARGGVLKQLSYNALSKLPNALLGGVSHLSAAAKQELKAPWPDIVIACGRRTVPVARWIKKQNPSTKLVYLMWPESPTGFDLICVPAHDGKAEDARIVPTLGPLHAVRGDTLTAARAEWKGRIELPRPFIGVFIGGPPKGGKFDEEGALSMLHEAQRLAGKGSVLVSTSRRTPHGFLKKAEKALTSSHLLYDWKRGGANPYMGILALSDALIVSGDSLSMCVEAAASGKPVFIRADAATLPVKHRALHEALYVRGMARPLISGSTRDWEPAAPLDEAARVAQVIHTRLIQGL